MASSSVEEWNPMAAKNQGAPGFPSEGDSLTVVTDEEAEHKAAMIAIDKLEQEYLAEYYMLKERDKADGKDFNKVAHDAMVRAQHHFTMLRKLEEQNYEEALSKKKAEMKAVTVPPVSSNAAAADRVKEHAEVIEKAYDPSEDLSAQKKANMIQRQLNRSKFARRNMETKKNSGARYQMFA